MSIKQRCGLAVALVFLLAFIQVALVAAADGDVICSTQPPILPNNVEYTKKCDNPKPASTDEARWPCFTQKYGTMFGTDIYPAATVSHDADNTLLMAKNGDLLQFTPKDAVKSFSIRYIYAGISLHYNPSNDPGCRSIRVEKWDPNGKYGLSVLVGPLNEQQVVVSSMDKESKYFCGELLEINLLPDA